VPDRNPCHGPPCAAHRGKPTGSRKLATHTYELFVVLDPSVGEEKTKAIRSRIEGLIGEHGGALGKCDDWGKRRLTFEIAKKREGQYVLFVFDAATDTQLLPELKRLCHIEESLLRHILVRAEVGKSAGDPALAEKALAAMASAPRGPRRERFDRPDRGGDRGGDRAPVSADVAVDAAPADLPV